jgi:hypothetical protein
MDYGFSCKIHPTNEKRKGFHGFLIAFQQPPTAASPAAAEQPGCLSCRNIVYNLPVAQMDLASLVWPPTSVTEGTPLCLFAPRRAVREHSIAAAG